MYVNVGYVLYYAGLYQRWIGSLRFYLIDFFTTSPFSGNYSGSGRVPQKQRMRNFGYCWNRVHKFNSCDFLWPPAKKNKKYSLAYYLFIYHKIVHEVHNKIQKKSQKLHIKLITVPINISIGLQYYYYYYWIEFSTCSESILIISTIVGYTYCTWLFKCGNDHICA